MGKRVYFSFIAIAIVGIGSMIFHGTLSYIGQLLDEVPMHWAVGTMAFVVCDGNGSERIVPIQGNKLAILLLMNNIIITVAYIYVVEPLFHIVSIQKVASSYFFY